MEMSSPQHAHTQKKKKKKKKRGKKERKKSSKIISFVYIIFIFSLFYFKSSYEAYRELRQVLEDIRQRRIVQSHLIADQSLISRLVRSRISQPISVSQMRE